MNTNELNTYFDKCANDLLTNGGVPKEERQFQKGLVVAVWLTQHGWERKQPNFWSHPLFTNNFVTTDKCFITTYQAVDGELVVTNNLPHPVTTQP